MPKHGIEREIPGVSNFTADPLKAISQDSCTVLANMGPQIQWVQSYVTTGKLYCVHNAPCKDTIREHAQQGGFPVGSISQVAAIIDPPTAE